MNEELNQGNPARRGFYLALAGTALAALVVALGAFTRLVDAGLGCPDWPGCYGHLFWPSDISDVELANMRFPETPVDHAKTWPEMVHRYFAGTLGLVILALAVFALRNQKDPDYPFRLPVLLLILVIWQALFGMWTVTLKLWPQVVTLHLLGGVTTFALMAVLSMRLAPQGWRDAILDYAWLRRQRIWIFVGVVIVFVQIALGGWTAANYAAFACPDLPTCQQSWWPPMDWAAGFNVFQDIGPNYLGGLLDGEARTAIHFAHRLGAIVTALYLLALGVGMLRAGSVPTRRAALLLMGLLVIQLSLGLANVHFLFPLPVAVLHNFVGALLLLVMAVLSVGALALPARE